MDVRPDGLARTNHPRLLACQRRLDEHRDLDRVRVRETRSSELVCRGTVDRGRVDEVTAHVSGGVSVENEEVDVMVQGGGGDGLCALDVEVVPNRASSSAVTSSAAASSAVTSSVVASSAHSLDAEAVASSIAASSSAASSSTASSTTVSSMDASLSAAAASTSTAASSSMTPVTSATAPYQWMFKENTRL